MHPDYTHTHTRARVDPEVMNPIRRVTAASRSNMLPPQVILLLIRLRL